MKFWKYESLYDCEKRQATGELLEAMNRYSVRGYYEKALEVADENRNGDRRERLGGLLAVAEDDWYKMNRPYFRVWPAVMKCAEKIRLNIPVGELTKKMPVNEIAVEFSKDQSDVRAIFIADSPLGGATLLTIDTGHEMDNQTVTMLFGDPLSPYTSSLDGLPNDIEEIIQSDRTIVDKCVLPDAVIRAIRVALMIKMMGTDSDLVTPDLLNKHKKWLGTDREDEFHAKAKKRGKFGWDVGKELHEQSEVSPHFRVPHFAVVWTGKGRSIPKFVLRTGKDGGPILVKPDKMTQVPTGYYGPVKEAE